MRIVRAMILAALLMGGTGLHAQSDLDMALALQSTFRRVALRVLPVVVEVNVIEIVRRPSMQSPFDFFFGRESEPQDLRRPGLGSGVVVRRDGLRVYVLTNNHVVGEADEIQVRFIDGKEFDAELIGADPRTDLALIAFDSVDELPVAELGDSETLQVGDFVLAVGNPLGFEGTVTSGIVSAVGRRPDPRSSIGAFTDFIQTDASINPGNSGGGLANLQGQIVGINTWIASQGGGSVGLGFAVPINVAKRAIDDFISRGEVVYGWLGVFADDPVPSRFPGVAESLGVEPDDGVLVTNIVRGSPADQADLSPGDFITSTDGVSVSTIVDLRRAIALMRPGESVEFGFIRNGEPATTVARIVDAPGTGEPSRDIWPGFYPLQLVDSVRARLRAPAALDGVLVSSVIPGSAADRAGLLNADIITRIGSATVETPADVYRAFLLGGMRSRIRVWRRGTMLVLELEG